MTLGRTGFIAPAKARHLGDALETLASRTREERDRIREHCLDRARTYSARAMFENTRALYDRCVTN